MLNIYNAWGDVFCSYVRQSPTYTSKPALVTFSTIS